MMQHQAYDAETFEYNGSSWTEGNNLNTARLGMLSFGGLQTSQTDALQGEMVMLRHSTHNGTSWSNGNNNGTSWVVVQMI